MSPQTDKWTNIHIDKQTVKFGVITTHSLSLVTVGYMKYGFNGSQTCLNRRFWIVNKNKKETIHSILDESFEKFTATNIYDSAYLSIEYCTF